MSHAVITGGTGGLGSAIAKVLLQAGWAVDALGSKDLDLRQPEQIAAFFSGKPIDLLVCAAGVTLDSPLIRLGETTWDETFAINYAGARDCALAALPAMIAQGSGHIIFISSQSAIHPPAGQAAYGTAKAALLGLTKALAACHGRDQIRVNAILPGFLETKMTAGVAERRRKEVLADHSMGRFNTPEAVASFIDHLHHHLPHTSGQIFQLDSRA